MTDSTGEQADPRNTRSGECFSEQAKQSFARAADAFRLPTDAENHFRQARIELLKGFRELISHRIDRLSRTNKQGTTVIVE